MKSDEQQVKSMPWWVKILIIILFLPVFGLPKLLAGNPETDTAKILIKFYPIFVLIACVCAWYAYKQRPELTWIVLFMLALSHIAMYLLTYPLL